MESEPQLMEHELRVGANGSSPRGKADYSKLPPLPHPKSPELNYKKKNKEIIKQLKEKRQKQQEMIEKTRKKEEEEREKLKQLILEEAARVREQKKQKEVAQPDSTSQSLDAIKPPKGKGKDVDEKKEDNDEETEKEKEDKAKLYHYYRSRHVLFLKSLKENQEIKKEQEEHIKKKKEKKINKIREAMGINNISSKFYDFDKAKEKLDDNENENGKLEGLAIKKSKSSREKERPHSSEAQTLSGEAQRALLERQKKAIADILEKKKNMVQAEEEKLKNFQRQREKLKEKVLGVKKTDDHHTGSTEDLPTENKVNLKKMSSNLEGLDLGSSFVKKEKKKKPHLSLPPIRDKQEKDDEDDDKLYGGLEKIPESTKSAKKKKKKLPTFPNVTDMATWKKRHRLDPETKVFIINGGYGDIKAAIEKRGWIENPDQTSPCFDFKWTLRAKDIDHGALLDHQIVNHFEKNTSITTKAGLCKNLRNLIWFDTVDIDMFYPKCYDLSDVHDYEEFLEEFKCVKAESIVKQYVKLCKNNDPKAKDMELKVQVALKVYESRLVDLDELLEDQAEIGNILVSPEEWEILSNDELTQKALALKKHEAWLAKNDIHGPKCSNPKEEKKPKKKKKKKTKVKATNKGDEDKDGEGENEEDAPENELLDRAEAVLEEAKLKCPQSGINGDKNIWIVKPAGLSRGRGISCFRNLVEIQDYVKGKEAQWIAQKYIENPLVVHKRKFDIRQWILVADWNPLTIWYYEECYIRFSAEEYDTENLDNKFVHLTNNSIGKYHENQDCPTFEQNMWKMETFSKYLEEQYGSNVFEEKIKPQMKQCVIWSLECVQDMVENRKNSHEFYGVDFMIDEDLNVWLIEINSSPDMEYSTPVTKRLVKTVSDDIVKVVIDYNLNPEKKKKKEIDTGLFTLIHKSKRFVEKPLNAFGLDLVLEGKKISKCLL